MEKKENFPHKFLVIGENNKRKKKCQENTVFNHLPSGLSQNGNPLALSKVGPEAVLKAGPRP